MRSSYLQSVLRRKRLKIFLPDWSGRGRLIDIRLNNVSQLAGFAKRDDLRYFLRTIGGIEYFHRPELAYRHKKYWMPLKRVK